MLAKHTKHLSLIDVLSVGVDRIQRNFEPMRKQVEAWKSTRIPDEAAKLVIYRAFVEGESDVPKHLARRVRRNRRRLRSNGFIERARSTLRELPSIRRRSRMGSANPGFLSYPGSSDKLTRRGLSFPFKRERIEYAIFRKSI